MDVIKRKINDLANDIIMQMAEIAREANSLALERAERKYRAELAAVDIQVRQHPRNETEEQQMKELDRRGRNAFNMLRHRNEKDQVIFSSFLKKN